MPAFLGDAKLREKFQDEAYVEQVEEMFREKFTENLSVSYAIFCTRRPWSFGI